MNPAEKTSLKHMKQTFTKEAPKWMIDGARQMIEDLKSGHPPRPLHPRLLARLGADIRHAESILASRHLGQKLQHLPPAMKGPTVGSNPIQDSGSGMF